MTGDLISPLLRRSEKKSFFSRNHREKEGSATPIFVSVLVALILSSAIFLPLREDRFGGEPFVVLDLAETQNFPEISLLNDKDKESKPVVSVFDEDLPEDETGQVIIRNADGSDRVDQTFPDVSGIGSGRKISGDPRVIEYSSMGFLPRVGANGEMPREVYARSFNLEAANAPGRGYIAIVLGGLGINPEVTEQVIQQFPADVSLAFAPYGIDLQNQVNRARRDGHEVLLQIPMEPLGYPDQDPGPHTLLTGVHLNDNLERLHWMMARFTGYWGVTNYMGEKFINSSKDMTPILQEVGFRGLAFLDDGSTERSLVEKIGQDADILTYRGDVAMDIAQSESEFDEALLHLEKLAATHGYAVGSATALPETIVPLLAWLKTLESRGFVLVPASAMPRIRDRMIRDLYPNPDEKRENSKELWGQTDTSGK